MQFSKKHYATHTHYNKKWEKKTEGGKITEIVATNVVASQLPEQQPTATLNACAKIQDDKQYLQSENAICKV